MYSSLIGELAPLVGTKAACEAVGLPRASYYRVRPATKRLVITAAVEPEPKAQVQPSALSEAERSKLLRGRGSRYVRHGDRFAGTFRESHRSVDAPHERRYPQSISGAEIDRRGVVYARVFGTTGYTALRAMGPEHHADRSCVSR